jgi:hypothetical protein
MKYRALWFLEVVLVVALFFVLFVPIQDYAIKRVQSVPATPIATDTKGLSRKEPRRI